MHIYAYETGCPQCGQHNLFGHEGDDLLDGGAGNDVLLGGAGDDLYVFRGGVDRIGEVNGTDTVFFGAGLRRARFTNGEWRNERSAIKRGIVP